MSNKDLEALFEFMKTIQTAQKDISEKIDDGTKETGMLNLKFAVFEKKFETLADKVDGMLDRCKTHEEGDLKKARDFMLIHDAREKTILGVRTDLIAWLGLLAALVAIWANLDKVLS